MGGKEGSREGGREEGRKGGRKEGREGELEREGGLGGRGERDSWS